MASEGATSCNFLFGGAHPSNGSAYAHYHFEASGWGGRWRTDGNSATCLGLATDVTQRGRVQELVATALEWGGGLDILVNNAGISGMAKFSSFMELSDELWDSVMAVNLKGAFLCSQEAARPMIEQRSGKIIHISSVMGLTVRSSPPCTVRRRRD